jgi:hypothetical protein
MTSTSPYVGTTVSTSEFTTWGSHSGGYEEFCVLGYNAI